MADDALKAWAARGLHEVLLPSGTEVRIRIPEVAAMARAGALPDDLIAVASRFVTTGINLDSVTAEERLQYTALTRSMVAGMLRSVRLEDGSWEEVIVTAQQLDELELPPDDLRMLELIATRRTTPAVAAAAARTMIDQRVAAGRLTADDLADGAAPGPVAGDTTSEEAGATVHGWASFRGEPSGADDREGGGAVRPVASPDLPADRGPGPGAGRRRGTRPSAERGRSAAPR